MLSCKDVTEMASLAMDETLPLRQRASMRLHLWMCKHCRNYTHQLGFIHRTLHDEPEVLAHLGLENETLSAQAKEKIQKKLKQQS